jgi:hypothetical protein
MACSVLDCWVVIMVETSGSVEISALQSKCSLSNRINDVCCEDGLFLCVIFFPSLLIDQIFIPIKCRKSLRKRTAFNSFYLRNVLFMVPLTFSLICCCLFLGCVIKAWSTHRWLMLSWVGFQIKTAVRLTFTTTELTWIKILYPDRD